MQEFGYLSDRINRDRSKIAPVDVALENLKQILIVGFGIKITKKNPEKLLTKEYKNIGSITWTTQEKEAWLKAEMPNPTEFLREYRNGN